MMSMSKMRSTTTIRSIFASNSYYSDITEMAGEYKRKFGTYLPDDFDYEAHLAFFSGAQYC